MRILAAIFLLLAASVLTLANESHPTGPDAQMGPAAPERQTQAQADVKSKGCVTCHTASDRHTMHANPGVVLGCTDCHGGDAAVERVPGSEYTNHDKAYLEAKATAARMAGPDGIDRLLAANNVVALVAPTGGPAWSTDLVTGDHFLGSSSSLAAVSGYPHITVPMGEVRDLPVGLSFFGAKWSEATLLGLAYAYEQKTQARAAPEFFRTLP